MPKINTVGNLNNYKGNEAVFENLKKVAAKIMQEIAQQPTKEKSA